MGFLPNVLHDNSGSISINQVNKFYGYNHNKVISDSEFFDMENMCGDDFPALSVRNGRSLYHWNEIKASYLDIIRVLYCKMYEAIYRILLTLPNSSVADMTFEEYLKSKNLEYLLDNNSYQTHLAGNESEFLETYFSGNYNGSIDFDGLFIVMGSYVYYKSMVICEVADNKKVIVPIGEKIAIFPDKIIVDINKAKAISEKLSTNINDLPDEYQTSNILSDYFAWNLKMFESCVSPIDAEHNYVGTGDNSPSGNLLKNTDFLGIDFSLSQTHINKEDIALDEVWYVRPYINRSETLAIQSFEDAEKGNCLKVELSKGNIHGLYQKVKYSSGGKMNLKLTFYAKANERIIIKPYISIGSVKSNIGRSFWVDTEWTEICIEENIIVPESGEFIVSIDGRDLGGTVIFSSPKCERIFSEAEIACNVEMTHYTLSGHVMSENLLMSTDFSDVEDKELSGFSSNDELDEVWKISCSVGKNTTLKTIFDDVNSGSLCYELSDAATIRGIYQEIQHNDGPVRVRFSFYARADRNNVPIKPYISSSNTVEIDKGKTFYLSEEWQKITVERTFSVRDGKFTVSFDGIAAGSARKIWFSQPDVRELFPKNISTDFKVLDSVHLCVEYSYDGQLYEAEHDAVIYNISDDGSVLTFNDYALLALFPEDCIAYEAQPDGTQLAVPAASELMLTNLKISRKAPDIDFACGCHNRIWGVNKEENVVYSSYYNDASNWNFFEGITADSFYGECTSPGKFTGAISYGGYPLFFKERYLITVYGSDSSEFFLSEKEMRGVEEGSEQSLVCMNEALYYKSFDGIIRFTGGLPVKISNSLGNELYHSAISGADYSTLYISMLDSKNTPFLFVYDANTGFWYKEDALRASGFVFCENKLRLIEDGSGDLITLDDPASNEYIRWFFESGDLYDSTSYKKYIWRLFLRIGMHRNSKIKIYLQYNSNGVWELQKELESSGRKTFSIPLQCQRTDHLKLRIEGCGKITIYSLARRFIVASDI